MQKISYGEALELLGSPTGGLPSPKSAIVVDDARVMSWDTHQGELVIVFSLEGTPLECQLDTPLGEVRPVDVSEFEKPKTVSELCATHTGTDVANALAFKSRFGNYIRYCCGIDTWLIWNDKAWMPATKADVQRSWIELLRQLQIQAKKENRTELLRWLIRSEDVFRIRAVLELAQAYVSVDTKALDSHPQLLNMQNGILDLENGVLLPHDSKYLLTRIMRVNYKPEHTNELWERFVVDVLPDSKHCDYMQRAIGYALSGQIIDQVLFVLFGPKGNNGKSTFLEAILYVFGSYGLASDPNMLMLRRSDTIRTDLARLRGARFVKAVEVSGSRKLDSIVVKQLTGKDTVVARNLYVSEVEIVPTWKIFLGVNDLPEMPELDPALQRRIKIIPFDAQIINADGEMQEKLLADPDGIMTWIYKGYLSWKNTKLTHDIIIDRVTDRYLEDNDGLSLFLHDRCRFDRDVKVAKGRFYAEFVSWCKSNGYTYPTPKAVGSALHKKGLTDYIARAGPGGKPTRYWNGLTVKIGITSDTQEHIK